MEENKYLLIHEDGEMSTIDEILPEYRNNVDDGVITIIRFKDNKFQSLVDGDGNIWADL